MINESSLYKHINYIDEAVKSYENILMAFGLAQALNTDNNFAHMNEAMGLEVGNNHHLIQLALYTSMGSPILRTVNKEVDAFIGSNKNNACPIVLMRSLSENKKSYLMWHLALADMKPQQEIQALLPSFFHKVKDEHPELSLAHLFANKKAEILVTHTSLLSKEQFNPASTPTLLPLPEGLYIKSVGLDQTIRSYSIAYFPLNDMMVLSGEGGDNKNYFWLMKDPFGTDKKWIKTLECEDIIEFIKTNEAAQDTPMSALLETFYDQQITLMQDEAAAKASRSNTGSPVLYAASSSTNSTAANEPGKKSCNTSNNQ